MLTDFAPTISTSLGQIKGKLAKSGQMQYLGIPYAEVPVGELRFRPTVPKKPWSGIFEATSYGNAGPQVFDPSEGDYQEFTGETVKPEGKEWVGSEDNLTLNIITPSIDGKRPVVVWIHGGANWLESSRLYTYHGDDIVKNGDIVFVSLNYRLGIFGWLDVSVLGGEEYRGSHSHGLRDQITALRWIKENIASFGGDAENITIMGESAGSIDLSWLLSNGHLKGIAKRVILMSGIAGLMGLSGDLSYGFTEDYSRNDAKHLLEKLNIRSMEDLLSKSTKELMDKMVEVVRSSDTLFYMDSIFWPRVSDFTPVDPFRAVENYNETEIEVIIGYTGYEMGLWLTWDEKLDQHSSAWAAGKIQDFKSDETQRNAVALYEQVLPQEPDGRRALHMIGDSIFVIPALWFAEKLAANNVPVWVFQFDWEADERRKAMHAADQTFLFNSHDTQAGHHICGHAQDEAEKSRRLELTRFMQQSIFSFAKMGNPGWEEYDLNSRPVMSFNYQSAVVSDPMKQRREWWFETVYGAVLTAEK